MGPASEHTPSLPSPANACVYRVRKRCAEGEFTTIAAALAQWGLDKQGATEPLSAVIDIADSATYHEAPQISLEEGEYLQLRAANQARPVLYMVDERTGEPTQIRISGAPGSRLVIDGLLVSGGGIAVTDGVAAHTLASKAQERFLVTLRRCTLVPGGDADGAARAPWRGKASVHLHAAGVVFRVVHSVVGPIRVANAGGMLGLHIGDSIVDAGHAAGLAITDAAYGPAPARASFVRSTVIGLAQVEEIALAENSIFLGPLLAARRSAGSVRNCYLAQGSRTPRREQCQPEEARCDERVRPRFLSLRYGAPGYGQLAPECAGEIRRGADDHAAMGACHDRHAAPLFQSGAFLGCSA
jgi:hypothetical protein